MNNRLLQILNGKTIAIVGNGNIAVNYSNEIDSADIVIRFNHFYNYDSGNVGKKIDVVIQTITPVWEKAQNKHVEQIKAQRPEIFLCKNHFPYTTNVHKFYGNRVRVNNTTKWFDPYSQYTTGTTFLRYLADHLTNAKVKCYGFQDENDWQRYLMTDAKNYNVQNFERPDMLDAIRRLESLELTTKISKENSIPRMIVIPVKANSTGCPGKNTKLIDHCLAEAKKTEIPITLVGDDYDLFYNIQMKYNVNVCALPAIGTYDDITESLRKWHVKSGFCGDVAIVQCTAPYLTAEWITTSFNASKFAPVVATASNIDFKPTALFSDSNGVYVPLASQLPPASVARQLLPHVVKINGAVVVVHTDALACNSIYQDGVMCPVIVPENQSLDVDTKQELDKAIEVIK